MKLSNSPQELTVLRLEARKSFSFNVSISDGRGLMMDLTDCVVTIDWLNKLIAPREPDTTDFTTVTGEIDDPASGVIRFDIQASQLMLKQGSYPFAITLIALTGYSVVLVKGEIQLLENTEFESSEYTYPDGDPLPGIDVVLRDKQVIEVNLDTFVPPAQGPEGPAGPEGPRGPKGEKGDTGDQGPPGEKGDKGDQGIQGVKGDTGNTGSPGATGPANVLNIGTVTTVTPGQPATASITGTTPAQTLNLGIPSGLQGAPGVKGDKGDTGAQGPPAVFAVATELGTEDLNSITSPGVYAQTHSAEATTGNNYPIAQAGLLEVFKNVTGTMIWQRYTVWPGVQSATFPSLATYIRGYSTSATWTTWKTIYSDTDWTAVPAGNLNTAGVPGIAGSAKYKMLNQMAYVYVSINFTGVASNATTVLCIAGTIPAAMRPVVDRQFGIMYANGYVAHGWVGTNGEIGFLHQSGANRSNCVGSILYQPGI